MSLGSWFRENILGDESRRYQDYANRLKGLESGYNPYLQAGTGSLSTLLGEYQKGLTTPSFLEDQLASSYQRSPYEQAEEEHLKRSLANQAGVMGDYGSSFYEKTLANTLHRLLSGDMDKYIDRGIGTYSTALSGTSALPGLGMSALGQRNALQQQALQAQLQGNLSRDQATNKLFGYGGRLASSLLGGMINPSTAAMSGASYMTSPVGNPYETTAVQAAAPYFI